MGESGELRFQFIRGGLSSAVIQATSRIVGLGAAIVLARSLGVDGYGIYVYSYAILTLLMVAAEIGMPTLLVREVAANHATGKWRELRGILLRAVQLVIISSASVSLVGLLFLSFFGNSLSPSRYNTMLLMLFVLPFAALSRTVVSILRGLCHVVVAQMLEVLLRPLLALLLVFILFYFYSHLRQPQYAMLIQLVAMATVLLLSLIITWLYLPAQVKSEQSIYHTRRWVHSAVPLTIFGAAGVINHQADIVMLGWLKTTQEVAVYRVAFQGTTLVAFGLQVANMVVAPHFSRLYAKGDLVRLQKLVTASARIILLVTFPLALTFILTGDGILRWIFGAEFGLSYAPLAILAVGQLINAAMGSVGLLLNMTGHERDTAKVLWQTAILNIILNLIFIPFYGALGAAIASTVSLTVWNVMLFWRVQRYLGINSTAFCLGTQK